MLKVHVTQGLSSCFCPINAWLHFCIRNVCRCSVVVNLPHQGMRLVYFLRCLGWASTSVLGRYKCKTWHPLLYCLQFQSLQRAVHNGFGDCIVWTLSTFCRWSFITTSHAGESRYQISSRHLLLIHWAAGWGRVLVGKGERHCRDWGLSSD